MHTASRKPRPRYRSGRVYPGEIVSHYWMTLYMCHNFQMYTVSSTYNMHLELDYSYAQNISFSAPFTLAEIDTYKYYRVIVKV